MRRQKMHETTRYYPQIFFLRIPTSGVAKIMNPWTPPTAQFFKMTQNDVKLQKHALFSIAKKYAVFGKKMRHGKSDAK